MSRTLLFATVIALAIAGITMIGMVPRFFPPAGPPPMPERYSDWQEHVSTIDQFRVMMPTIPHQATERLPVPQESYQLEYHMYAADSFDGATFSVSTIKYPPQVELDNVRPILDNVMNELVASNPANELTSFEVTQMQGLTALDFVIDNPKTRVAGRVFVAGQRLFLLSVIDKSHHFSSEDFQFFVNSFSLIGKDS